LFFTIAAIVFALDRLSKYIVVDSLVQGKSVALIKDYLYFTYTKNFGAAFGLFSGYASFLIIIGIIISVIIVFYYFGFQKKDMIYKLALGLILGGSLGNLYDRIFLGYVVDFIDIRVLPIFNFADMMINLGVLLLITKSFISERKSKCSR